MALPNEKNLRSQTWPDYALFLVALAFCAFSAKAFFRAPSSPSQPKTEFNRGLASVAQVQTVEERSTRILDIGCTEKPMRADTEASLLRLTASDCKGEISRAINESTGENLMLFEREKGISTHYFPLRPGQNRILIEWKDGKKAKIIEIKKAGDGSEA